VTANVETKLFGMLKNYMGPISEPPRACLYATYIYVPRQLLFDQNLPQSKPFVLTTVPMIERANVHLILKKTGMEKMGGTLQAQIS